jgi:hypothetical protein
MVCVRVRDHDGTEVRDAATEGRQTRRELLVVPGIAGVDDRELAVLFDEVPVDPAAPEPVDAVRDALDA